MRSISLEGIDMAEIRSGGPSWWSLLALALGVGIICWLAFTATSKEDTENYRGGKTEITIAPVYTANPLSFPPCGRIFDISTGSPTIPATQKPPAKAVKK
jgi:hypothetical protein